MSDFTAVPAQFEPEGLLQTVLDVSLSALLLLRPQYGSPDSAAEATDFALEYLNPAGQQLLTLPPHPEGTLSSHFSPAVAPTLVDFCRRQFNSAPTAQLDLPYPGLAQPLRVAARRHGEHLIVSFLAAAAAPLTVPLPTEAPASAPMPAEAQRQQFQLLFRQVPVAISYMQGPDLVITDGNPLALDVWSRSAAEVFGRPFLEALPEMEGQGFDDLLREVMRTGVPFVGREFPARLLRRGELRTLYFDFAYQPLHDDQHTVVGVMAVGINVTEQVLARRQVERLNQELSTANEELLTINQQLQANNQELLEAQQKLRHLNEQLELQAVERTRALHQARAEVTQQQQRLERFFNQAPAAICVLDGPDLVYELVNPAYQQLFPTRQLLQRRLDDALPELVGTPVRQTLQQVYETGETHEEVGALVPMARTEGGPMEDYYFHYIQQARYNEQGEIDGIIVFAIDMTEQMQVRQRAQALRTEVVASTRRLAQERETFYQAFARTPAAICILHGPEHRLQYFNAAYEQLFEGRQLRGRTVAEVQPEAVEQGFVTLLDQVYETGETYYGTEMPLLLHDAEGGPGRQTYFNFTYQAYQHDGETVGISVFAYDVTEQVRARQQNEQQRRQLQQLFQQAPVAVAVFRGPNYVIELANPTVCAIWGRTPEQALNTPLFELLPEAAGQGFEQLLDGVMTTGQPYLAHELPSTLDRNGRRDTVYWNFVYQPLRETDDRITGVIVVATDCTEQVLARQQVHTLNEQLQTTNEQLQQTNRELTHSNVDLDNFIYTASHDLKAPITNIEGLLYTLTAEMPAGQRPAEVSYILELMQESVERFKRTIENLTDVARLRQEQLPTATMVNLREVLLEVQLDLASLIHDTGAHITRRLTDYATVVFSPKNLRNVLYNLLSNALKYHSPDRPPRITISTRREGEFLVLEVQDNGLGLPENSRGRLFGMFQRFHSHVEGTGIGLYMVRKMVENAGGHLEVSSEEGVGSTFSVYFRQ